MDIIYTLNNLPLYEYLLIGLYSLLFVTQLIYYLFLFRKPYRYLSKKKDDTTKLLNAEDFPGITIIITAKNEAENLRANLPFILEQDYPNFQVVVVNNASTDSTEDVLNEFFNLYPSKLYVTYIPIDSEAINNKKLAITVGIKASKHNIVLFTEPDSKPLSNKWVYEYAKEFINGKDVVLGGFQLKINKSFFQKIILFGNLSFGIKYLSMALIKKPYMGIERNMAYRKSLFYENKGFSSILNIEYGEDNLFINKIANKNNTAVIISPESMVESSIVDRLATWRTIKGKYLITKKHLSGPESKILTFEEISRYGFYFLFLSLFLIGLFHSSYGLILISIALFLIRYIVQLIVINKNSRLYNAGKYFLTIPFLDLLTPIINLHFLNYEKKRNMKH